MFAQLNKSIAILLIFLKLLGDLFKKSRIALEFYRNFRSLVSLVRPRASRNLEVGTPATTYLTDPRAYQEEAFDQAHLAIEISLDAGHGGMVN